MIVSKLLGYTAYSKKKLNHFSRYEHANNEYIGYVCVAF